MLRIVSETYTTLILDMIRLCKAPQLSLYTLYQDRKDAEDGAWNIYYSDPEYFQAMQGSSVILDNLISGS